MDSWASFVLIVHFLGKRRKYPPISKLFFFFPLFFFTFFIYLFICQNFIEKRNPILSIFFKVLQVIKRNKDRKIKNKEAKVLVEEKIHTNNVPFQKC